MIEGLIGGAIAGAAYGIVGYVRNKEVDDEFDWNYFIPSVAGAALVGAYAQYSGLAIDVVSASAIGVVVTQAARKLWNVAIQYYERKVKG